MLESVGEEVEQSRSECCRIAVAVGEHHGLAAGRPVAPVTLGSIEELPRCAAAAALAVLVART